MRNAASTGATAVGGAALVGTIVGFFGARSWVFDLLANFRVQYAIVLAASAGILALLRRRRLAAVAAVGAVINAGLVLPLYAASPVDPTGEDRLVVVSFNVQLEDPVPRLGWMLDGEPDVVILFESSRVAEERLRNASTGYVVTSGINEGRNFGPTVLSRTPLTVTELPITSSAGGALRIEVPLGDEVVAVYGVHPASPSNAARTGDRDRLLEAIGLAAAGEEGPVVVVGDFNATPWSHAFGLVSDPAELVNSQRGFGYSPTWPAGIWPILGIPLDHLIHSASLTTVSREVGPDLGPDHRPIRVTLAAAGSG